MKKIFTFLFGLIVIIFSVSFIYKGFGGFDIFRFWSSLFHSDFYINYQGGFVRRGLDGEAIFQLAKISHTNPITIQKIYNLLFFIGFIGFCVYFYLKYKPIYYVYFSMSVMLLYIYYLDRGLRKDHITLAFFIASILVILSKSLSQITKIVLVNLILIIGSLIHEILFVISFFPILIVLNISQEIKIKTIFKNILYLTPAGIVFLIVVLFYSGTPTQEAAILNSWKPLGLQNLYFNSGIFSKSLYFSELKITNKQVFAFFIMLLMHFLFVGIPIYSNINSSKLRNAFVALIGLQYVIILVLSFVAIDYSRWVFMGNFTTIITIYLLKSKYSNTYETAVPNFIKKIQFIPYILYFFVTMPHSCWTGLDGVSKHNPIHLLKNIYMK